ncbi:K03549 KUP system potassium uptake protein [Lactiplantibacillus plantarum]|nr:K03549 KUP system potassium uptake protein [Lactiplantibacillus plantarum]
MINTILRKTALSSNNFRIKFIICKIQLLFFVFRLSILQCYISIISVGGQANMNKQLERVSFAGALVTLGIVYGDIGTSPLYVMNALIGDAGKMGNISPDYVIGSISLIFWTLMIITTLKYVVIAMQADNKREGGIFALYALVRENSKWLIWPALIGGAAILADGTLTPAVTVTSAIEGLKNNTLALWYLVILNITS